MADFLKAAGVSREPLGHIQLLVLFPNSSHKLPCRPPALQAWDANVATSEFLLTCVGCAFQAPGPRCSFRPVSAQSCE